MQNTLLQPKDLIKQRRESLGLPQKEFTSDAKNRNLKKVGFLAIYCPDFPVNEEQILEGSSTFAKIKDFYTREGKDMPRNINGNPFIRKLSSLNTDVRKLLNEKNIKNRSTIGF